MTRDQKISRLLTERGDDDRRRLALDQLDDDARRNRTWGTKDHRDGREKTEKTYEDVRRSYERMSDADIDRALSADPGDSGD